jgi:hypothetical protein
MADATAPRIYADQLLVVVAIIAVLIAILLPALSRARKQAIAVQCLSNLKQISVGVVLYASDNHNAALISLPETDPLNPYAYLGDSWEVVLVKHHYVTATMIGNYPNAQLPNGVFRCPLTAFNDNQLESSASYGLNPNLDGPLSHFVMFYKLNYIKHSSATIFAAEAYATTIPVALPGGYDIDDFESFIPFGNESYHLSEPGPGGYQTGTTYPRRFAHRHFKSTSCLFFDGHAELIKTARLDSMRRNDVDCLWDNN